MRGIAVADGPKGRDDRAMAVLDLVTFRRVLAEPYADDGWLRDAVDVEVNGVSVSRAHDSTPFGVDEIGHDDLARRWFEPGHDVPIVNCSCGIVACGAVFVDVGRAGGTVTWTGELLGRVTFDGETARRCLGEALRGV
jgi:hypothetical protein